MKKMICTLCIIGLLISGGSAAAAGANYGNGALASGKYSTATDNSCIDAASDKNDKVKSFKDSLEQKKQLQAQRQQVRQQIKLQLQAVKQNQKKVQILKKTINFKNREIQKELNTLRLRNSSVNKDKLSAIKDKLQIVKEDRKAINSINTDINAQLKLLKTFGKSQDMQGVQNILENIISMQQKQQTVFEKAVSDLEELHKAII